MDLEEIVVTGSRLRRTPRQGAQQVDIYTREEIQSSGQNTVSGFLNTRKEFGPGIQGEQGFPAFSETSTVQLRALPFGTTLVLINGRRAPSIALNNGQFFNLNTIPAAAVERIEVLPQGSSASRQIDWFAHWLMGELDARVGAEQYARWAPLTSASPPFRDSAAP